MMFLYGHSWVGPVAVFLWLMGWVALGFLVIYLVDKANGRR